MFQYLKGSIEEIFNDYCIIEVNNIGYKVAASANTLSELQKLKDKDLNEHKIFTYVHVKEDGWTIYGFLSREELKVFELLITVSGVGPKIACGILSVCSPSRFVMLVAAADVKGLSKLPGIGAKTAQRIILELKDKVNMFNNMLEETGADKLNLNGNNGGDSSNNIINEAVEALLALGYSATEAKNTVSGVIKENDTIEMVIKKALTSMMKK
jgi:Holliday junction DNA helicase RuvA